MSTAHYLSLSDGDKARLLERLRARAGEPLGAPGPAPRDAVNRPMIHHLCDALGDTGRAYLDEDFAKQSVFGGVVAPATSLQVWGMGRPRYGTGSVAPAEATRRGPSGDADLVALGFQGVVATNCEQIYERPIRAGDSLRTSGSLDSVSDEKNTALGIGYFTTTRSTYTNQDGEVIGHHLFRILRYIPGTGKAASQGTSGAGGGGAGAAPAAPGFPDESTLSSEDVEALRRGEYTETELPRTDTLRYDKVQVGDQLPRLILPMFPLRIIASALSTRDFQDVHHDRDAAQAKRNKDIFPNILTTNGWVGRFVTDWTGPEGVMQSCAIRLGVPSYCYDILRFSGEVTAKQEVDGRGVVEVAVRGSCSLGDHVTGTVRIALP